MPTPRESLPPLAAEIEKLRAEVEAHEIVRDACFAALPDCQVWADVPAHIAAMVEALKAVATLSEGKGRLNLVQVAEQARAALAKGE